MRSLLVAGTLVTLGAVSSAPVALADAPPPEAATARLGLLTPADRAVLDPHLSRGPIALVEFSQQTELPGVLLAVRVRAPARSVVSLIANPRAYPRFMPALDEVAVEADHAGSVAYRWQWRTAIFTLRGNNVMTVYPPPQAGTEELQGYRIGVRSTGGDLGQGRMMWRVYPEGPSRSLLILASRIDMRDANYIARQMSAGGNGINRTINISLGFVMLLASKAEAEKRAGVPLTQGSGLPALRRPSIDYDALAPLLVRGDLVMMELMGEQVSQVAVVGRMGRRSRDVLAIMTNPEAFGRSLVHGSQATVVSRGDEGILFDWRIPLPLIGASGRMRLAREGERVSVDAVSGNLEGGQWRFETHDYPWGEAAVLGWGRFDPADASWLLERLVSGIPWFNHGLTAGSQIMVMRSIRSRVMN